MTQRKYVLDLLLKETGKLGAVPSNIPMILNLFLDLNDNMFDEKGPKIIILALLLLGLAVFSGLWLFHSGNVRDIFAPTAIPSPTPEITQPSEPLTGLANPASVYCIENGVELELTEDSEGNQNSNCVFADGTICSEWAFYRGQCGQGKS